MIAVASMQDPNPLPTLCSPIDRLLALLGGMGELEIETGIGRCIAGARCFKIAYLCDMILGIPVPFPDVTAPEDGSAAAIKQELFGMRSCSLDSSNRIRLLAVIRDRASRLKEMMS